MAIRSEFLSFFLVVTDIPTADGRTDGRTDKAAYRDARTHLKREKSKFQPYLSLGACLAMCFFFEETEPSVLINCVLTKKISV